MKIDKSLDDKSSYMTLGAPSMFSAIQVGSCFQKRETSLEFLATRSPKSAPTLDGMFTHQSLFLFGLSIR